MIDLYRNDKWIGAKIGTSLRDGLAWVVGPKNTWAKIIAILIAGLLAFSVFAHGTFRIESPFVLEASEKNVVPAPYEGYLKSVGLNVNADTPEKRSQPLGPGDEAEKGRSAGHAG